MRNSRAIMMQCYSRFNTFKHILAYSFFYLSLNLDNWLADEKFEKSYLISFYCIIRKGMKKDRIQLNEQSE